MITRLTRLPFWLLIGLSSTGVILGDFLAKTWSVQHRSWLFWLAMIGYLISGLFYIPTLAKEGLIVTSIIWSLAEIIGFLVIGLLIFHERLTHIQAAGAALGVVALVLLTVGL